MTITGPVYMHVQEGTVARTVECGSGVQVDVDESGRILGIESLDNPDFYVAMFVAVRRLRVAGGAL